MLTELRVNNYVLIESLQLQPGQSLNTITGETGAGKSILIGALGLILGDRADSKAVAGNTEKCVIEGVFDLSQLSLNNFFEQNDLDYLDQTILRREITSSGRSRAFVNDTPVSLNILKDLGEQLVDIHSQHQVYQIADANFLFKWLDAVCMSDTLCQQYKTCYTALRTKQKALAELKEIAKQESAQADYNNFLWDELDKAGLKADELDQLESEGELLQNAEEIGQQVSELQQLTVDADVAIIDQLRTFGKHLLKLSPNGSALARSAERLQEISIDLEDVVAEIRLLSEDIQTDTERLELINNRRLLLHQLLAKHRVTEISELIKIRDDLSDNLYESAGRKVELAALETKVASLSEEADTIAKTLHKVRVEHAPKVAVEMNTALDQLGLPNAKVALDLSEAPVLSAHGKTVFQIMFSSNKGQAMQPAHTVASGGELSRLMLIFKGQMAKKLKLPSIIFDEIDTGVSGEIAKRMADVMADLSSDLQVIAITHLPQIAAKGKDHFYVYKESNEVITKTQIKSLHGAERINEIAKMLSGDIPTEGALVNAKELLAG